MPTMRDVARHANVSIATVSHVINDSRPVSDELRQRVQQAMAELGYHRNTVARALRSKQSLTIGVIVPDSTNPFFAEVTRGIEDVSLANDYSAIICDSRSELAREIMHTNNLLTKQVDGIIYVAGGAGSDHISTLAERELPVVLIERDPQELAVDAVLISNYEGAQMAVQHLLDLGHQRVACITGPSQLTLRGERLGGFVDTLVQRYDLPDEYIAEGGFSCESGYVQCQRLLKLPTPPTAIFCFNDLMAIGALRAAHEAGVTVPDELSIVGFDDVFLTAYVVPPLTTIRLPIHEMGSQAMELILDRIAAPTAPPNHRQLPIELVIRASTAPPPVIPATQ